MAQTAPIFGRSGGQYLEIEEFADVSEYILSFLVHEMKEWNREIKQKK